MESGDDDYLAREARARKAIDKQLRAAGWAVQHQNALNLSAATGVAVREFTLEKPHGRVDYLLFVNGKPTGVIEAKPLPAPEVIAAEIVEDLQAALDQFAAIAASLAARGQAPSD
jgi:type I site-specific restriction endonuclease